MALQMVLNEKAKFGRVYKGISAGEGLTATDEQVHYYQHGLYFGADKKLLVDHPYNAEKIALFKKMGMNPDEPRLIEEKPDEPKVTLNPEVVSELSAMSDEDIHARAIKLVEIMKAENISNEYEPKLEARNENIDFIARHLSN